MDKQVQSKTTTTTKWVAYKNKFVTSFQYALAGVLPETLALSGLLEIQLTSDTL